MEFNLESYALRQKRLFLSLNQGMIRHDYYYKIYKMKKTILIIVFAFLVASLFYRETLVRLYQGFHQYRISKERAQYYQLHNVNIQDITQELILDESIPFDLKQPLIDGNRRIVIFKYLSDSDHVAGYISYITQGNHPLMIFLRGGNGYFGIMRPNNRFSFLDGYNVVGTLYRGNIYGGVDELGGSDIQDIEQLIKFFPQLESFINVKLEAPYGMIGVSRGAMEMFVALSQLEYVKERVSHAISVSGNVDLHLSMARRPEMKYLFQKKFKQSDKEDFEHWIQSREPASNASNLSKSLKVLLVYGLADNRVFLEEQLNLEKALKTEGIATELVTIPGASHGLEGNFKDFENIVKKFMVNP